MLFLAVAVQANNDPCRQEATLYVEAGDTLYGE
jgi:hypothetical protein